MGFEPTTSPLVKGPLYPLSYGGLAGAWAHLRRTAALHEQVGLAVTATSHICQGSVRDVRPISELTRPSPVIQLSRCMHEQACCICIKGNLLNTWFEVPIPTGLVAQRLKCFLVGRDCVVPPGAIWPIRNRSWALTRLPPVLVVICCPGRAIVYVTVGTGDCEVCLSEIRQMPAGNYVVNAGKHGLFTESVSGLCPTVTKPLLFRVHSWESRSGWGVTHA